MRSLIYDYETPGLTRVFAGSMTLLSAAPVCFVSPWWLLPTCFVGLNLIQSAFLGFCPPSLGLHKLGWLGDDDVVRWGGRSRLMIARLLPFLARLAFADCGRRAGVIVRHVEAPAPVQPTERAIIAAWLTGARRAFVR